MSTKSRLGQLRELSRAQRRTLAEAVLLLPLASLGLRIAGVRRTHWLLRRAIRPGVMGLDAEAIARLVAIARRHGPYRASCLPAALTLQALLRRGGIASELKVGVRKQQGILEAHAWIEHEGRPLMEAGDVATHFTPFERSIESPA